MIKHMVMWTLKEENKTENAKKMVNMLNDLQDKIDEIVSIEAGQNFTDSDRNYDIGLIVAFNSEKDLNAYRVHPAHQEVVEFVKGVVDKAVAVDYNL